MKRIGTSSTGNVIVEMTSDEFNSLDLTICQKPPTPPPTKVATTPTKIAPPPTKVAMAPTKVAMTPSMVSMSFNEVVDYAIPRILKSYPKKKSSLVKFIEAMFNFSGGIDASEVERIIAELRKRKVLVETEGKITYLDV